MGYNNQYGPLLYGTGHIGIYPYETGQSYDDKNPLVVGVGAGLIANWIYDNYIRDDKGMPIYPNQNGYPGYDLNTGMGANYGYGQQNQAYYPYQNGYGAGYG